MGIIFYIYRILYHIKKTNHIKKTKKKSKNRNPRKRISLSIRGDEII